MFITKLKTGAAMLLVTGVVGAAGAGRRQAPDV